MSKIFSTKGFIEVCIMHPLDLIKTRLQLQIKSADIKAQTGNNVRLYAMETCCYQ